MFLFPPTLYFPVVKAVLMNAEKVIKRGRVQILPFQKMSNNLEMTSLTDRFIHSSIHKHLTGYRGKYYFLGKEGPPPWSEAFSLHLLRILKQRSA